MRASRSAKRFPWLLAMLALHAQAAPERADAAWLRDGSIEVRNLVAGSGAPAVDASGKVPLGSLWKLFVFDYLSEKHMSEPAYACSAARVRNEEEKYCCNPGESGESIGRAAALARSCAPYFSLARLGIDQAAWQAHWQSRPAPAWLTDVKALKPDTVVPLGELLQALSSFSAEARAEAKAAMLETGTEGYGREAWSKLGSGIRYKTYSWHLADGSAFGGAAGWLADGTPFWFGARGSSRTALAQWADRLASVLPEPERRGTDTADTGCVDVDFFARYPLRAVWRESEQVKAKPGELKGRYRLEFMNGNWLRIAPAGDLALNVDRNGAPSITGRIALNDYVARVVDREGSGRPEQAARALAIAARSYLVQNGRFEAGCWHIADSSGTQRVSPNPPSDAAWSAAWFTDDIVLGGVPVHYHRDAAGANRLAWRDAVRHAEAGWDFERILSSAYPRASIATVTGREECKRLPAAESWLAQSARAWQRSLRNEGGFEAPDGVPTICVLADGHPYSDQRRMRIYARGWRSLDERVTLAHEYLHLAFRFHPNGADEDYIERLARRLLSVAEPMTAEAQFLTPSPSQRERANADVTRYRELRKTQ